MFGCRAVFGVGPHARTTTVCAAGVSTGEVGARTFRGNPYSWGSRHSVAFARTRIWMDDSLAHGKTHANQMFVPGKELPAAKRPPRAQTPF